MVTELKWPDTKVKGAIELCTKRRLTKKCLYSQEMKYLVLVTDKVESGSSRSRSLEQEMSEAGIWDTEFSLGDLINLDDESEGKKNGGNKGDQSPDSRVSGCGWPRVSPGVPG